MKFSVVIALVGVSLCVHGQTPGCYGTGLLLRSSGGRLGDELRVQVGGAPPLANGILGVAPSTSFTPTPWGDVCLSLPDSVFVPLSFDLQGQAMLSTHLSLGGAASPPPLHLQAASFNPMAPGFTLLSNAAELRFRPPGSLVVGYDPVGAATALVFVDAIGQTASLAGTVPGAPDKVVHLGALGWVAVKSWFSVRCVDLQNGATVFDWTPPNCGSGSADIAVSGTGDGLLYLQVPDCFVGTSPPSTLLSAELLTGLTRTMTLGGVSNSASHAMLPIPGTSIVYVRNGYRIYVIDHSASTVIAFHDLFVSAGSGITDWCYADGKIYIVAASGGLAGSPVHVIDTTTHQVVNGPVIVPAIAQSIRLGPGTAGPGLWVVETVPLANPTSNLYELDPATLALRGVVTTPYNRILDFEASNGGTEWYGLHSPGFNAPDILFAFDPQSGSFTPTSNYASSFVFGLGGGKFTTRYSVLPSGTLNQVHDIDTTSSVRVIPTDPLGTPSASIPLPMTLQPPFLLIPND